MRLADFIRRHRERLVDEWEAFATTMAPAAGNMTGAELREHASELLEAAANDLERRQSHGEQGRKPNGWGSAHRIGLVAEGHAMQRLRSGFRLPQVLAEYRALRARVVHLWEEASPRPSVARQRDLTRFHEVVDEALTDSISRFAAQLDEYRDQFLGVLAHDLRNPLAAISMSATALALGNRTCDDHVRAARRIMIASQRMGRMVAYLLELTRARLGEGITISRQAMDLGTLCAEVINEMEAAYPARRFALECRGGLRGLWDRDRLAQTVSNLVANALQHGDPRHPVTIQATADDGTATVTVHNFGKPIPQASLKTIFDPMVRSPQGQGSRPSTNLGLGLFIVREIVTAHGGTVHVTSTADVGTTFAVSLPQYEGTVRKPPRSAATGRRRTSFRSQSTAT